MNKLAYFFSFALIFLQTTLLHASESEMKEGILQSMRRQGYSDVFIGEEGSDEHMEGGEVAAQIKLNVRTAEAAQRIGNYIGEAGYIDAVRWVEEHPGDINLFEYNENNPVLTLNKTGEATCYIGCSCHDNIEDLYLAACQENDLSTVGVPVTCVVGCAFGRLPYKVWHNTERTFVIANDLLPDHLKFLQAEQDNLDETDEQRNRLGIAAGNWLDIHDSALFKTRFAEGTSSILDTIYCVNVLHLLKPTEVVQVFCQAFNMLKPGGKLFIGVSSRFSQNMVESDQESGNKRSYFAINTQLDKCTREQPDNLFPGFVLERLCNRMKFSDQFVHLIPATTLEEIGRSIGFEMNFVKRGDYYSTVVYTKPSQGDVDVNPHEKEELLKKADESTAFMRTLLGELEVATLWDVD